MQIKRIPFPQVPQFSEKDVAYAEQNPALRSFYKYDVNIESFGQIIEDKRKDPVDRAMLVQVLKSQYQQLKSSEIVEKNIDSLLSPETFTITTAHQPSLFTGPLYFIYKIVSAINLSRQLNAHYPNQHFVPIFITGGEDHDFEEINHAQIFGKTVNWENEESGAVGQMSTSTLKNALAELKDILGSSENAEKAYQIIEEAYTSHTSYGMATVHLVNTLFKDYGLVVLNPNHTDLKQLFTSFIEKEILEQPSKSRVEATVEQLIEAGFSGQAHAREINFFYLRDQLRERIVENGEGFEVLNTDIKFSKAEIQKEIQEHPERFSPNVIMRPLYQELILPNLAYIGGGGELAYWLERKTQFDFFGLNYPMLIRRNSVLWLDKGGIKRLEKLGLKIEDFLPDVEEIIKDYVKQNTKNELNLSDEKKQLEALFDAIEKKAVEVDQTMGKTVLAEKAKQLKSFEQLEGKLLRAEKQRHDIAINQIRNFKDKYFPGNGLQERKDNFLGIYLKNGETFFETLLEHLDPLKKGFIIISEA
jgi:bacillithiol biosynthesis cysteine-adding enzyme BshC